MQVTVSHALPVMTLPEVPPKSVALHVTLALELVVAGVETVLLEYTGGVLLIAPTTAVHVTLRETPSSDCMNMPTDVTAEAELGAGATVNGQMTKLLTDVDSLRAPVAFGRNAVSVVGMLNWQLPPWTTMYCDVVAACETGATVSPSASEVVAKAAQNGILMWVSGPCRDDRCTIANVIVHVLRPKKGASRRPSTRPMMPRSVPH